MLTRYYHRSLLSQQNFKSIILPEINEYFNCNSSFLYIPTKQDKSCNGNTSIRKYEKIFSFKKYYYLLLTIINLLLVNIFFFTCIDMFCSVFYRKITSSAVCSSFSLVRSNGTLQVGCRPSLETLQ